MQNNIKNMLDRTRLVSLHMMLLIIAVILLLFGVVVDAVWPPMMAKPGCQDKCGNVTIPYPFGKGPNCYYNEWYSITCDNFTPTLSKFGLQVIKISLSSQEVGVYSPFSFNCTSVNSTWTSTDFSGSPYTFSTSNVFAPVHCPATTFSYGGDKLVAQCGSVCDKNDTHMASYFLPVEPVCLTDPPHPLNVYSVNFTRNSNSSTCSYVFLVDFNYLENLNLSQPQFVWPIGRNGTRIPVKLDWVYQLSSDNANPNCAIQFDDFRTYDYTCECPQGKGLGGNPYLPNGCQHVPGCDRCKHGCWVYEDDYNHVICDDDSVNWSFVLIVVVFSAILRYIVGIGSLFFAFGVYWLRRLLKRRTENKQRALNFKLNGGLLLQQQISSKEGVVEKAKLFTFGELEVATDHFNQNRILGQGGQGTVYRGMLADGKIIAVKKSKKVDKAQLTPFINEVVILSQINHRNVVKLLGCCLETDVPLLVYEFIPNGTLSQHIHNPSEGFRISWPMRLQIASESAGAIAYLHSSCSAPIYHRDIKSSNILLDEKYRAKVSDFGISRTIMIDQTHLTTQVAGTFGYFDPEYFLSTQFTDKSDVYSFGVVLVELLTSRRPISAISADEFNEWRSLSSDFLIVMENCQLSDILDGQILEEGKMEEFLTVANLAKECLNACGKQRPTMKQVATVLEGLRSENGDSSTQPTFSELNQMNADLTEIEMVPSISSTFSSRRDYLFLDTV